MLFLGDSVTLSMGSLKLMRRFLPLVALLAVLVLAESASARTLFVINGNGWGHGVGLSQYGAYGMARGLGVDGPKTWRQIIAHYFHNTTIGDRGGDVSVLLADNRSSVTIGDRFRVEAGARSVSHLGDSVVTKTSTGRIKVSGISKSFASPATFFPTGGPLHLGAKHYRGQLIVRAVGGGVRVVNRLGIDAYVRGVVTNESPASWGDVGAQEALNAQAVAARVAPRVRTRSVPSSIPHLPRPPGARASDTPATTRTPDLSVSRDDRQIAPFASRQ